MDRKLLARTEKFANLTLKNPLSGGRKGVEKESLRIDTGGHVALSPHPATLGSTLTHPWITTDYSEALLELITPPLVETTDTLTYLNHIHQFVYRNLQEDELLWTASMPCVIGGPSSVPLAWYGESNVGMMKHIYRRGLDVRYGRIMQAISGIHFNYSVPEGFWEVFQEIEEEDGPQQPFIDRAYMGLTRNALRFEWLITYLFGSSPAFCKSFMDGRPSPFEEFDKNTYYDPFATSLRMSGIGYKNNQPAALVVSYNSLSEYIRDLVYAIETPYEEYEELGVKTDGFYQQLNANILQIENEYYSSIRPKQPTRSGEKPTSALRERGIRYVELRALDVNTFEPLGINEEQTRFLEVFMLFCLLRSSLPIDEDERSKIALNQDQTARFGRDPNLTLYQNGSSVSLRSWADEILQEMEPISALLDNGTGVYGQALASQRAAVQDSERTASARTLKEMRANKESFFHFALRYSEQHSEYFRQQFLPEEIESYFKQLASESIKQQAEIEAADNVTFEEYLRQYFERP